MEELQKRIEELEKENRALRDIIDRGNAGNSNAYNSIRAMIVRKVEEEIDFLRIEDWRRKHQREKIERNIMSDLKWEIRVRRISDFRQEHIEQARKYLQDYIIDSPYKKAIE